MMYAIVKDGKAIKTDLTFSEAAKVLKSVKSGPIALVRVPEVKKSDKPKAPLRNEGKPRNYRATTLERIAAIIKRGIETPKYALYAYNEKGEGILVASTRTEKGARYIRRKARGFTRRVLCRKYSFKILKVSKAPLKLVA